MKIKIYNSNGNIIITKIASSGVEQTIFCLNEGELAEIDIECNYTVHAEKTELIAK